MVQGLVQPGTQADGWMGGRGMGVCGDGGLMMEGWVKGWVDRSLWLPRLRMETGEKILRVTRVWGPGTLGALNRSREEAGRVSVPLELHALKDEDGWEALEGVSSQTDLGCVGATRRGVRLSCWQLYSWRLLLAAILRWRGGWNDRFAGFKRNQKLPLALAALGTRSILSPCAQNSARRKGRGDSCRARMIWTSLPGGKDFREGVSRLTAPGSAFTGLHGERPRELTGLFTLPTGTGPSELGPGILSEGRPGRGRPPRRRHSPGRADPGSEWDACPDHSWFRSSRGRMGENAAESTEKAWTARRMQESPWKHDPRAGVGVMGERQCLRASCAISPVTQGPEESSPG
ncbi:hypothetical protein Cadr_000017701 [Camelus dromedarius]|uniref:Uncharacterized protein n=1 Tax=Camelus dromedarius TaxID=9838 RepID=A0A5N4D7D9_CAMDR|nr:hypothetical protein Cadr_000017701 [Camelus dromedarius]